MHPRQHAGPAQGICKGNHSLDADFRQALNNFRAEVIVHKAADHCVPGSQQSRVCIQRGLQQSSNVLKRPAVLYAVPMQHLSSKLCFTILVSVMPENIGELKRYRSLAIVFLQALFAGSQDWLSAQGHTAGSVRARNGCAAHLNEGAVRPVVHYWLCEEVEHLQREFT